MRDILDQLLRAAGLPHPERAEQLWAEYRAGGPNASTAFATLMAWYGGAVYRRVWGFVRSDAADDVFQDVLIKLHRQRAKLSTFADAQRWLRTVATTECVDAHRRNTRRKARERVCAGSGPSSALPDAEFELQDALRVGLAKLSAREREAVALVFFEEMTRQDAAKVLGVHRDTFAKLLDGALAKLRATMALVMAGVVTSVESALSAHPLPFTPARLGELAGAARVASGSIAIGCLSGKRLLVAGVVVFAGMAGGIVLANYEDAPANPTAKTVEEVQRPIPIESVPDRNLRVFKAEVLPLQLEAFRKLVVGPGDVVSTRVETYDTRVDCEYELRHRMDTRPNWVSRFHLIHWTRDGRTYAYSDVLGKGERKPISLDRPIYSWRTPLTGKDFVARIVPLDEAIAAFDRLPRDERTAEESWAFEARLNRELASYSGIWYARGNPAERYEIAANQTADSGLSVCGLDTAWVAHADRPGLRLDLSNRIEGVCFEGRGSCQISSDGQRIEFNSGEWWSREVLVPAPE